MPRNLASEKKRRESYTITPLSRSVLVIGKHVGVRAGGDKERQSLKRLGMCLSDTGSKNVRYVLPRVGKILTHLLELVAGPSVGIVGSSTVGFVRLLQRELE